ncbi:hypothetical protein [Brevibacillus massiliensis]|jgi:hypothetical protein|uniref:hypothetical protein n=1 Tax=Brevibacillus massiliensis TaxID=1118054 RepID=UPI00031FCF6D|nr:hypothetical protein [Brevibacillus massiliensis]
MEKPFERFTAELSWQQAALLLDTVLYFEETPKYLSLPDQEGGRIAVPLLSDSLRDMLAQLDEAEPHAKQPFTFDFDWTDAEKGEGVVTILLPSGEMLSQPTQLDAFSAV